MKLPLWLICFVPFLAFAQPNQHQLVGRWVKFKAEMKDGSRIIDRSNSGEEFLAYEFTGNSDGKRYFDPLFDAADITYRLFHDTIAVAFTSWVMEKTSPDTLKLRQVTRDTDLSRVRVIYFVNVDRAKFGYKATFDPALHDSVYKATPFLFPQCKDRFDQVIGNMHAKGAEGSMVVHFIVGKTGKVINVTSTHNDSIPEKQATTIQRAFEKSAWKPAVINYQAVNVSVDIKLEFLQAVIYGQKVGRLLSSYPFMPVIEPLGNSLSLLDRESVKSYFETAVLEMQKKNYSKAADYFGQCIEMDNIDLDSYYNRAECYRMMGDIKRARADWSHLAELGQTRAKLYLKQYNK